MEQSRCPPTRIAQGGHRIVVLECCVEVEYVGYLKADSVHKDQVSANKDVCVIRRRGRKHNFQFTRARFHLSAQAGRQSSIHDQLPLEPGRQTIPLGQAGRQIRVVRAIPIVNIAVAIPVVAPPVSIAVFTSFMPMTVTFLAILPAIATIPIVFVVAVAMALRHRHGC